MAAPSSMGAAALTTLFPFLLFLFGHYFSLSFVFADFQLSQDGTVDGYDYYYDRVGGGGPSWPVSVSRAGDFFVAQVMAVSLLSYLLLCLSTVAAVSASSAAVEYPSGRRQVLPLALESSFSKLRALWRQPTSPAARLYFAFLLLGYLLSLLAVFAATLAAAGDALSPGTWRLLVSLLALLAFLYAGILRWSAGVLQGAPAAAEEGGHVEEAVAKAPWSTALALMEEAKLQRFFLFFFSLVVVHGVLLLTRDFSREWYTLYIYENRWVRDEGFYENAMMRSTDQRASSVIMLPLLMSAVWVLGTCGLFRYFGVLLQVC